MSPLMKSCSTKAFGKNIGAELKAGKPRNQAVAIGFSQLKKSCGVETDKKLTPKEIVARGRNEAQEPFKAKLSSQLGNISAQDVDAVKEVIKNNAFMALREPLTKLGFKVSFMTDPFAVYIALKNGSSLAITNKKNVDNPDFVHGEIAMGLNESVEKSIFTSLLSDVCGLVGVKSRALGEKKEDMVGDIMAWEGGEMSGDETLEFFSKLVKNGQAWKLQGVYGRTAKSFIDSGYLDEKGNILKHLGEAAEPKRTVGKKPIMSWDTTQIAEDRKKDIMENPGNNLYVFDENDEFVDAWEESGQDTEKFIALIKEKKLYDEFEELAQNNAYSDSDHNDIEWDSLKDYLTEKIEEKNPDGYWNASVKNFGWRSLHGGKYFVAHDGEKLLQAILPDTDCTFYIYDFGKDGLAINNFHHDSPTGKEWYYITPVSHAEFENEGPISQAAVVDDLMNSGDFYTGFHSKSGPVSGTREEIRAHVVKALEAEAKAQAKNIEVEEFTEGDTAEFIHVTLVFPDKSKLDVSLEIALEDKDGKFLSKSADIGNTDLDEKDYIVQESVEEALGASGKPLNFPVRDSDPAKIELDSIKVEKMDLKTGDAWYVSWTENGERRASIRSWWDKAEADKLADTMRASIKSMAKTEAAAGITGAQWWENYVKMFEMDKWAEKGRAMGLATNKLKGLNSEWKEWESKFQEKLDRIIAALKSGEELPPRDLATPDTKTWGGKTTKALIELLGIKSVKDKADLRNKLKEKLVGMTEADRSWRPDFDDVDVNAKIDPTKFDPFEKSVIEKLMVKGVPKAKAVIVFINTFGEKGDDQLSPYMLELKTMLKKKGMLTEVAETNKLDAAIIEVMKSGRIKNDDDLHKWAEENKFDIHEVETAIYHLLQGMLTSGRSKTEEKLVETGEADQDYDKEFYDELVKQLAAAGYKGATHREFDKYQGVVLSVPGVDSFWVKDFFSRGEINDIDKKKTYRSSVLTTINGDEVSSSQGDYFQLPKDYVFKGYTLVSTRQNGETVTKKNPKVSDLPDITDVMSTFSYKRGSMTEHTILYPEHDNKVEIEVVKDADGKVQAAGLVRYCKTHKLKREALGESWVGWESKEEDDEFDKGLRKYSPWGQPDSQQEIADGIVNIQTPSHGGIWLSPERRKQLNWDKNFLKNPTWWEEDSDWAIPYYFFRDDIKASGKAHEFEKNLATAINTIKRDHKEFAKRENLVG